MARDTRDILFRFLGDAKSLERASGKSVKSVKGVEKGLGSLTKAVGALGLAFGAREVLQFGADAAKMAEQANLASAAADKVLGPSAQRLREDFEQLSGVMGFNALEFDQLIAKQGLLVTGMGASEEAAASNISKLIELGGEAAAFTGEVARTEEAIDAMTAAIRGEFDPLEQWGVKLSEAKIQAEITRRIGVDPLFAAMEEGEQRIEVITGLIEEALTPALGSLEGAADTAAGKQNALTAEFENMKIELGQELLPALQDLTQALIDLKPLISGVAQVASVLAGNLGNLASIFAKIGSFFGGGDQSLVQRFIALGDAIERFFTATPTGRLAQWLGEMLRKVGQLGNLVIRVTSRIQSMFNAARNISNVVNSIPFFHSGGTVPGPAGSTTPAVLMAGEKVIPRNATGNMGHGGGGDGLNVTINIGVAGDPQATAQAIVNLLETYNRNQGALPVEVRTANGVVQ